MKLQCFASAIFFPFFHTFAFISFFTYVLLWYINKEISQMFCLNLWNTLNVWVFFSFFLVSIYSLPPNIFGVFLLRNITPISLLYSEYHNCERKGDLESHIEEECEPIFPATDLNKIHMETNKEGTSMHYESPDGLL